MVEQQREQVSVDQCILEVCDLRVVHPGRGFERGEGVIAVDEVNLRLDAGEIVGLVGESGSGKSTLALSCLGLGRLTSGSIEVLGRDIRALRRRRNRDLRAQVQMVFQDPHGSLDPRQSIRGGLSELRRLHRRRTAWISDEDLMVRVGLGPEILDRLPHQISGGQAQRISIARALLLRPRLLIADEPTSGLDVSVQAQILNLLLHIRDEEQIAILFISHDLSVVRHVCGRVHVMKDGEVVEAGETEELLGNPQHPYTQRLIAAVPARELQVATPGVPGAEAGQATAGQQAASPEAGSPQDSSPGDDSPGDDAPGDDSPGDDRDRGGDDVAGTPARPHGADEPRHTTRTRSS